MKIVDGEGSGAEVGVDSSHRMKALATNIPISLDATVDARGYSINSGVIALTSSTASGVLYYKHLEERPFIVQAALIGVSSAGTVTDVSTITIIKNPTTGTLISGASAVAINQNLDFSSSSALSSSIAYKGAEGNTVTDGDDVAILFHPAGGRLTTQVWAKLTKGNSIAIKIDTNTSSGTTNVYAGIVGHLE